MTAFSNGGGHRDGRKGSGESKQHGAGGATCIGIGAGDLRQERRKTDVMILQTLNTLRDSASQAAYALNLHLMFTSATTCTSGSSFPTAG